MIGLDDSRPEPPLHGEAVTISVVPSPLIPQILQVTAEMDDGTVRLFEGTVGHGVALPADARKIMSYGLSHVPADEMFKSSHSAGSQPLAEGADDR